ncbi:MAG TPA: pyridoxamine 5'-phosphate oxidase [Burkholderiales bacterium]|nr:pyridoxamine 5'-phosphate oxidase [Burkholderiales bacterium]
MDIANLRKEYTHATLEPSHVHGDPLLQFDKWLRQAIDSAIPEPTAMTLATVDDAGRPSARMLLLKGVSEGDFVFYTNYRSRKGNELATHAEAALLFFWPELERQVRVEGSVKQTTAAESDEYFQSRPLASRIGAWASPQSEIIQDRAILAERMAEFGRRYGENPPRPPHWGGYRLRPRAIEFWQGRPNRLHDRLRYSLREAGWVIERLAP